MKRFWWWGSCIATMVLLLAGVAIAGGVGSGGINTTSPVNGANIAPQSVATPYLDAGTINVALLLCNGVPCFTDAGFDDAVDLLTNQTAFGIKSFASGVWSPFFDGGTETLSTGLDVSGFLPGSAGFCTAVIRGRECYTDASGLPRHSPSSGDLFTLTTGGSIRVVGQSLATGQMFVIPRFGISTTAVGEGNAAFEVRDSGFAYSDGFCTLDGGACWTGSPGGSCQLNGGTPSTCTATVKANTFCGCFNTGNTVLSFTPSASLSGTTLTCTGGAASTAVLNYICQ